MPRTLPAMVLFEIARVTAPVPPAATWMPSMPGWRMTLSVIVMPPLLAAFVVRSMASWVPLTLTPRTSTPLTLVAEMPSLFAAVLSITGRLPRSPAPAPGSPGR